MIVGFYSIHMDQTGRLSLFVDCPKLIATLTDKSHKGRKRGAHCFNCTATSRAAHLGEVVPRVTLQALVLQYPSLFSEK